MAVKLRRPILVGGIGLSLSLWLLQSLHHSMAQLGEFTVLGAIALGGGFWFFQKRTSPQVDISPIASTMERETVEKAIAQVETAITILESEAENHPANLQLRQQVVQVTAELDRKVNRIAVTGGKNVGKTTLVKLLENSCFQNQQPSFSETTALFTANDADVITNQVAIASDLILFLTAADLTDPEFQTLQQMAKSHQKIMLVFNKQDQYVPDERLVILNQLRQRMQGILNKDDVVAIAAEPGLVKVRQHQPDGSLQEWMEKPAANIAPLTQQLEQILSHSAQQLILASAYRQAVNLKTEAKTVLNQVRRERALPIIEQYQWIVAATALANPVPALDLLATAAINAQLIIDLGNVYQQNFSLQQAQTIASTIGSLMVKLGLVELSTQAVGGMLKSNAITFVAGGVVQGVSAAYLTRLAGLSLIEYFQVQETATTTGGLFNIEQLSETLKQVFLENQRVAFLQAFIKQGVARLMPESTQPEIMVAETAALP
ncbi:MAG TPA: DUF697 domain-containing protein [Oculatellaceae cyanobacterium]|jgi:uncharacterized protein (DUF697 family)/GTP-binding protein EngB required for normal cell division